MAQDGASVPIGADAGFYGQFLLLGGGPVGGSREGWVDGGRVRLPGVVRDPFLSWVYWSGFALSYAVTGTLGTAAVMVVVGACWMKLRASVPWIRGVSGASSFNLSYSSWY